MPTDPRIDAYIAGRAPFAQDILIPLRALLHRHCPAVEETIRWGMPSFSYRGRPLAGMAAFKQHASFGFWDREALKTGQEGEGMGQFGKLRSRADLPDDAVLIAKLRDGMAMIDAGERPHRAARASKPEPVVPPALAEALANDPAATATFEAFSPSCRRDYCDWIAEAKRDETRARRVAETLALLRAGKKRNWKYEAC